MLEIANVTLRVGGRALLEGASAAVPAGHKVGLVGRNGTGKTTLLRLIMDRHEPDQGAVNLPRELRLGTVAQEAPSGAATPRAIVLAALGDREDYAAPARAAQILAGLGFDEAAQQQPIDSFSGGWRMRVALAAALFSDPDLLLLDEPTNHLDFEAASWLEAWIKRWPGTLIMVSHDREFLNATCDGILHLAERKLAFYPGNYDRFVRVRGERLAHQAAMAAKQETERKRIQAFVDRFRAKASKARQAQSRIKALERMTPIELAEREPDIRFRFPDPPEVLAPPLISLDGCSVGYDGKTVLRRLELRLDPDERIALLGANGNGKTTLARLIAGRLPASAGVRVAPSKLRVGYFAQHQTEELDLGETPLLVMSRRMGFPPETKVRAALGRFGFGEDRVGRPIATLSGGEKARLTFALIAHDAPHLLILDEPTNHLDLEAREALIEGLAEYPGAVVLVSHDRHLIELVAERLWIVERGTAQPFEGDLDEYRARIAPEPEPRRPPPAPPKPAPRADLAGLRRAARDAERELERLGREKAALDTALADPAIWQDTVRAAKLTKQRTATVAALEAAEARWLEAAEALESAG